jgi:hypothetical protein
MKSMCMRIIQFIRKYISIQKASFFKRKFTELLSLNLIRLIKFHIFDSNFVYSKLHRMYVSDKIKSIRKLTNKFYYKTKCIY